MTFPTMEFFWLPNHYQISHAVHSGSCLMPLLFLHNFFPGHKPLLSFQPGQATTGPTNRPKHVSVCKAKTSAMSGNAVSQKTHKGYWLTVGGWKECFWMSNRCQVHNFHNNSVNRYFLMFQVWKLNLRGPRVPSLGQSLSMELVYHWMW